MRDDERAEPGRARRMDTRARAWGLAGLGGVLAVGLALRLVGLTWGLPDATHLFSYHPDEFHSLRGAISLALGDANPHFFNYGSLYLYLVALAAALAHGGLFAAIAQAVPGGPILPEAIRAWTLDARVVTVILALGTIAVVWALGRALWGERAGLTAGLLLALAPLHVLHSHYATVDVPGAFFVALALLFAVRMTRNMTLRDAAGAGVAAGLAASVKYSGGLVLVAPLTAWAVAWWRARITETERPALSALLLPPVLALVAFAATSPYTFLDWPSAWRDISFELAHMRAGDDPWLMAIYPSGWLFHLSGLALGTGFVMLAVAAVGLVVGIAEGRRELAPLVVFGLVAFAVTAQAQVRYARYEIVLLPVIAVLAAGVVGLERERGAGGPLAVAGRAAAIALLLIGAVAGAGLTDHTMLRGLVQPDARDVGLQVIERRVLPDGRVGLLTAPWFYQPPVDYCNGGVALRGNPLWGAYRRPVRDLVVLGTDLEALRREVPDAVVVTGWEVDAALAAGDQRTLAFMAALEELGYERAPDPGPPAWRPGERPPASDWLYPFPRIAIYLRSETPGAE